MLRPWFQAGRSAVASRTATFASSRGPLAARTPFALPSQQTRQEHAHPVSKPDLADIEKRWEQMHPKDQAEIYMALADRMKSDWREMTYDEKKASYYIAFGPHGPRKPLDYGDPKTIALYTFYGIAASLVMFAASRALANPEPHTMTQEWQEATEEYMKKNKMEPITGYPGMMIQSPPEGQGRKTLPKPE